MRVFIPFTVFIIAFSCIEPYDFVIKDATPALVVESLFSDKSFSETLTFPSDGRYHWVKLSITSDVKNVRSLPVKDALVKLKINDGTEITYQQSLTSPGLYEIKDETFAARPGVGYKLSIRYNEVSYESDWQNLPTVSVPAIGTISFREEDVKKYRVEAGENVIRNIKTIVAGIQVGANTNENNPIYYRWDFTPTWIYIAPLSPSITRPGYKCWATNANYLNSYALRVDRAGNYTNDLFSMETEHNERIWTQMSVLVNQYVLSEDYFYFFSEMKDRVEGNAFIDKPPFNLKSNIRAVEGQGEVVGFFGVVQEQATRWYFSKDELTYKIEYSWKKGCETPYGPPLPCPPEPAPGFTACECKYCLEYSNGKTTNVKPAWWPE